MRKNQKRILKEENRVYNTEWELLYYIVLYENKIRCLLCDVIISTLFKTQV